MTVGVFFWVVPGLFLLFALAFAFVGWSKHGTKGARWAALGFLVAAAGSVFDTQREYLPPPLLIFATPAHWLAVYCLLKSFMVRSNVDMPQKPLIVLWTVAAIAYVACMFIWPSTIGRIVQLSLLVPIMIAMAIPPLIKVRRTRIDSVLITLLSLILLTYPLRLGIFVLAQQYMEVDATNGINWSQYSIIFYLVVASIGVLTALALMLVTGMDLITQHIRAAIVDPLTGIGNRRAVDKWIASEEEDAMYQYGAVLMIDLDHFKKINDSYGHAAGDDVLKVVAQELSSKLNGFADVARIGGEEFVALIRKEHAEAAGALALTTRSAIAAIRFKEPLDTVTLTASVGFAVREKGADIHVLIKRADMAVYQAKAAGRNQTMKASMRDRLVVLSKVA
jgi:diguanylate cyclase (GGDEF)-like protein